MLVAGDTKSDSDDVLASVMRAQDATGRAPLFDHILKGSGVKAIEEFLRTST